MHTEIISSHIALVVDTERYAGNFERQMTAFCTGAIGDCGVGEREAADFRKMHPESITELMEMRPDDHGTCRPAAIWPTPGRWNDGLGNHWKDHESDQQHVIDAWRKNWKIAFPKDPEENMGKIGRHPAYMSVIMYMSAEPDAAQSEIIISRIREYCTVNEIPMTRIRLIRITTEAKTVSVPYDGEEIEI